MVENRPKYSQQDKISATEMGWNGVDNSRVVSDGNNLNLDYVKYLEHKLETWSGRYVQRLTKEMSQEIESQRQVLNVMCFEDAHHLLRRKINGILGREYQSATREGLLIWRKLELLRSILLMLTIIN